MNTQRVNTMMWVRAVGFLELAAIVFVVAAVAMQPTVGCVRSLPPTNSRCEAAGDPWPCCTGLNTGTCGGAFLGNPSHSFVVTNLGDDPDLGNPGTNGTARITVRGYETFGSTAGELCACGLNLSGLPIASVTSVLITGAPDAPNSFLPDPDTSSGFNAAAGGGSFAGFFTQTGANVAAGTPTEIQFDVVVDPFSTVQDLATALQSKTNVVGTDEALAGGALANTHLELVDVGFVALNLAGVPALSGKLALLLVVLMGGAIFVLVRRGAS